MLKCEAERAEQMCAIGTVGAAKIIKSEAANKAKAGVVVMSTIATIDNIMLSSSFFLD